MQLNEKSGVARRKRPFVFTVEVAEPLLRVEGGGVEEDLHHSLHPLGVVAHAREAPHDAGEVHQHLQ